MSDAERKARSLLKKKFFRKGRRMSRSDSPRRSVRRSDPPVRGARVEEPSAAPHVDGARDAAVKEAAKLLSSPDALSRLARVRSEYSDRSAAVDMQVSRIVQNMMDEVRVGLALLASARGAVAAVEEKSPPPSAL